MKGVLGFKCEYADWLQTWIWTHVKCAVWTFSKMDQKKKGN